MALPDFPSKPEDGFMYENYKYNAATETWKFMGTMSPLVGGRLPVEGDMRGIRLVSDKDGVVLERGGLPWRHELTDDGFDPQIYYNGEWHDIVVPVTKQVFLKDLIAEEKNV